MDDCEKLMKPHELFTWDSWWENIVKAGEIPKRRTYLDQIWMEDRRHLKRHINKELAKKKSPNRLICLGHGRGIYLVCEKDVAEITADMRIRKIVDCFELSNKEMIELAKCNKISEIDRKMLNRLGDLVELQQNTMIGTMSRMKSLPPSTKKRLLKHLGVA
jgi:hypothetical protein